MPVFILLILLIPFQRHPVLSQSIGGFTPIMWVGFLCLVVALLERLRKGRQSGILRSRQCLMFIVFILIILMSWLNNEELGTYNPIMSYLSFFILMFITMSMVGTRARFRQAIWAITICMFISALYIFKECLYYIPIYGPNFRPFGGAFLDANYYSLSAVIALPFAYFLARMAKTKFLRTGCYVVVAANCLAILLALSRGAMIGLVAMLVTILLLSKKKARAVIIIIAILFIGVIAAPDKMWERFEQTRVEQGGSGTVSSTTHRWHLILSGLSMIREKPLWGVGFGNFKPLSVYYNKDVPKEAVAHNTFLEVTAELGIPALLLFLGIIVLSCRDLLRVRRLVAQTEDDEAKLLANSILVALVGFSVTAVFMSGQYTKLFWLTIFLSVAFKNIIFQERRCLLSEPKLSGKVKDLSLDSLPEEVGKGVMP